MNYLARQDFVILAIYTIILFLDYFKFNLTEWIPDSVLLWGFAGLIIYSLNYKKYKNVSDEHIMKWQIFSTVYIVIVVLIFFLVGGRSSAGLFFSDGMFIFLLLLSFFEIFIRWRKWEV
ncbi:hypothetical protein ACLIA0_10265 [Bacillaceae bacterium W0354]